MERSVAVLDRRSGHRSVSGGELRFAAASVVKVNVLVALLLREERLTTEDTAAAAAMIQASDNDAASALWQRIGGAAGLAEVNRGLGLRDTVPDPAWGRTMTTAADQIRLLEVLVDAESPLGQAEQRYALELMEGVREDQRWGVGALAGDGETAAVKNGWTPRDADGGKWTVNSIGRISGPRRDLLVAVLTSGHPTLADGIRVVARQSAFLSSGAR
ncbi:serine hydrolase [Actinomadura macrotermitis]|uniref:Putative lipoprotein LppW n=1 Tax=Actinomadura macrotermitis TaxID=2585200 RepID=A0A7K0BYY9_9ACTN|nr:serine hydrolase [Actinomadura macrotermitis]MQY06399.1 putative lipoprotein LppW [Actinomadura macrotermitis]